MHPYVVLITGRLATTGKAKKVNNSAQKIAGVGGVLHSSGDRGEEIPLRAHLVDHIPQTKSPAVVRKRHSLLLLWGLKLADSDYTSVARIDLLLDMGTANRCYRDGVLCSGLHAENSIFGWTVEGTEMLDKQGQDAGPTCLKAVPYEENGNQYSNNFWRLRSYM